MAILGDIDIDVTVARMIPPIVITSAMDARGGIAQAQQCVSESPERRRPFFVTVDPTSVRPIIADHQTGFGLQNSGSRS